MKRWKSTQASANCQTGNMGSGETARISDDSCIIEAGDVASKIALVPVSDGIVLTALVGIATIRLPVDGLGRRFAACVCFGWYEWTR
jgi:hypothetical protein